MYIVLVMIKTIQQEKGKRYNKKERKKKKKKEEKKGWTIERRNERKDQLRKKGRKKERKKGRKKERKEEFQYKNNTNEYKLPNTKRLVLTWQVLQQELRTLFGVSNGTTGRRLRSISPGN